MSFQAVINSRIISDGMEYERPGISCKEGEWSENRSRMMELRGRRMVRSSKEHSSRREFGLPKESKVTMAEAE